MQLSTYNNLSISIGNVIISNVRGDIGYELPNDNTNVEADSRGEMVVASNAQGMIRNITVDIESNSQADLLLKAILDAQNRPTATNQSLIGQPASFQTSRMKDGIAGAITYNFKNIVIRKRSNVNDIMFSTDGEISQSRVMYSFVGAMPLFANDGVFFPL